MTWQMDKGGAGETVWVGVDAIRDMWHFTAEERWAFGRIGFAAFALVLLIGGLAALSPLADALTRPDFRPDYESILVFALLGLVCLAAGAGCALVFYLSEKPSPWITRRWSLTASATDLVYDAGPFSPYLNPLSVSRNGSRWSVPLEAVARVEAGRSVDWQAVRVYEGKPMSSRDGVAKIPDVEYQTFLFMADGSRRVIYTANADREGAGTLAHSIRSWIEARRNESKSKTISPAELVAAGEEGFDL